ncbi:hypothetical protein B0H13DRAFT_1929596 [Mycena leptocephala]|nr:hypothetical protein B0H13DRAFT_1929596 [Mycena leptocephala]
MSRSPHIWFAIKRNKHLRVAFARPHFHMLVVDGFLRAEVLRPGLYMGHTSEDDLGDLEPRGSGPSKVYTYAREEQTASYGMQDGDLEQGAVRLEPFFWDWTLALETAPESAAFIEHDKVSSKNGEGVGVLNLRQRNFADLFMIKHPAQGCVDTGGRELGRDIQLLRARESDCVTGPLARRARIRPRSSASEPAWTPRETMSLRWEQIVAERFWGMGIRVENNEELTMASFRGPGAAREFRARWTTKVWSMGKVRRHAVNESRVNGPLRPRRVSLSGGARIGGIGPREAGAKCRECAMHGQGGS